MPNIRFTVSYDGTDFVGWQRQNSGPSVQQSLEEALLALCGQPIAVRAAGRTDAGVHAFGQVVTARIDKPLPLRALIFGTNHHLPDSIAVLDAQVVADDFDARFSASGKMYRYQLWNGPTYSPLHARTHYHVAARLDLEQMRAAAAVLTGVHDFAAFRAADCERKTTRRWLRSLQILTPVSDEPVIHLEVEATAFLKNMVRILVGTLIQVGKGRMTVEHVQSLLQSGNRTQAGPTAPAHGLTLRRVDYGPRTGY